MGAGGDGDGFRRVFAVAEFRALWTAMAVMRAGSQIGRVALAVLAYDRTGSASVTALVYALTLIPALIGGPLLGGIADFYSRQRLIVLCGLARAALLALGAFSGIPLPVLCALVFFSQLLESPINAAQSAMIPDLLGGEAYRAGIAVQHITAQIVILAGFAAGGALVATVGAAGSFALNAAAFALAAGIVLRGVRFRPAARARGGSGRAGVRESMAGLRLLVADPRLRNLLGLAMLAGLHIFPEILAVPHAADLGHDTAVSGLLMATIPAGNVIGVYLLVRFVSHPARLRLLGPLALAAAVPLLLSAFLPNIVASVLLWLLIGMFGAYQTAANAEFVRIAPADRRGQILGLASSALVTAQGLGMILGGVLAVHVGVRGSLALAGVAGLTIGAPVALGWHRARVRT